VLGKYDIIRLPGLRSELPRVLVSPALDDDLLIRVKLDRVASLCGHVAEETVFPSTEWEIGRWRGYTDIDANQPAQVLELLGSLIVQQKGAIYTDSEIGGTCDPAHFLVSGSLSAPAGRRNSFLPSENVTLLPTA
jgi:hypothetical protein